MVAPKFRMEIARKLQKSLNQRFGDLFDLRVVMESKKLDILSFLVTHNGIFN